MVFHEFLFDFRRLTLCYLMMKHFICAICTVNHVVTGISGILTKEGPICNPQFHIAYYWFICIRRTAQFCFEVEHRHAVHIGV